MMDEMIRSHNASYARYEELINRRDALRKEVFQLQCEYTREFGEKVIALFTKKIECIRKKKTIEYCQAALNHGQTVDQAKMQAYLAKEMSKFQEQLDEMVAEHEASQRSRIITAKELLEIKRIYHRLVKKIHPDINPGVTRSHVIMDLWHRVSATYACNDLKELQSLEVLVCQALENVDVEDLEIPDIEDRIEELGKEILKITQTDPYCYKELLNDSEAVEAKKEDLENELRSYEEYGRQLDEILEGIIGSGVKITWKMN